MEEVIDELQARRRFGKLLHDVEAERKPVVVERNGEPVAAVVPIAMYESWQRERKGFFESARKAAGRANLAEEEAAEEVAAAVREVRSAR